MSNSFGIALAIPIAIAIVGKLPQQYQQQQQQLENRLSNSNTNSNSAENGNSNSTFNTIAHVWNMGMVLTYARTLFQRNEIRCAQWSIFLGGCPDKKKFKLQKKMTKNSILAIISLRNFINTFMQYTHSAFQTRKNDQKCPNHSKNEILLRIHI